MALRWVFTADTGPFRKGLNTMRTESKAFSKQLGRTMKAAFAAFTGAGVVVGIANITRRLAELQRAATRLDVDVEFIQELSAVGKRSNVELDNMIEFLQDVNERAIDAARGTGEAADAFRMLGINAAEFSKLSLRDQFRQYADAVKNASDRQVALAATMKVGSDEAAKLIPTLELGAEGLDEITSKMTTFGSESVAHLQAVRQEWTMLKESISNGSTEIAGGLVLTARGIASVLSDLWADLDDPKMTIGDFVDSYLRPFEEALDNARQEQIERQDREVGAREARETRGIIAANKAQEDREKNLAKNMAALGLNPDGTPMTGAARISGQASPTGSSLFDSDENPFDTGVDPELRRRSLERAFRWGLPTELDDPTFGRNAPRDIRSIPVDSLRSIGGDSGAGGMGRDIAREGLQIGKLQLKTLQIIADRISRDPTEGTKPVAEPRG